jgi:CO/xanthine dehydrogenase FAD-binding subunit
MASYLRPTDLEDALAALASRPADAPWTILAGATDIYPASVGRPVGDDILDISALPGLRRIEVRDGSVRIPAGATWTDLIRADLPHAFDGLRTAARAVGGVQIQHRGTLCGNLCNASPAADGIPNLIALDARVELASLAGRRETPVVDFVVGNRRTTRRPDELVTAVLVPLPTGEIRSAFRKLGARAYLVISIAMVAVVVELAPDGSIAAARIVVGACSEVASRLPRAEARLVGRPADPGLAATIAPDVLAGLAPIDDVRASAAYRREAALRLVRRSVAEVLA